MFENQLKKLGFSDNLSTVYLALFELGKVKAGEIIDSTNLPRSVVYSALDELIARELATKTELRGVAMFSANDPERLVDEVEEKKQLAKKIAIEIKKKQDTPPREVSVYEGLDGIKRATLNKLDASEGETVFTFGASKYNVQPALDEFWTKIFHKKRIKKKIYFKGLYDRTVGQKYIDYRNSIPLSSAKYLPQGLEVPVWFSVCDDMLSIMVPEDDPPIVFNIRSRAAAEAIKKYFHYLWNLGSKS